MPATATYPLVDEKDDPAGLLCTECDRPMPNGSPYGEALEGMRDITPIVSICCVYCAMKATKP